MQNADVDRPQMGIGVDDSGPEAPFRPMAVLITKREGEMKIPKGIFEWERGI